MKSGCDESGLVIGFAGKIASGKTTLADSVAKMLSWPIVSFGGYIRIVAKEQGLDADSRNVLQDLGLRMLSDDPAGLCANVLKLARFSAGDNLLVDGVRHPSIVNELKKQVTPSTFRLVYVYTKDNVRADRLAPNKLSLHRISGHKVESEIEQLEAIANLRLDGSHSVDELTTATLETVRGSWSVR